MAGLSLKVKYRFSRGVVLMLCFFAHAGSANLGPAQVAGKWLQIISVVAEIVNNHRLYLTLNQLICWRRKPTAEALS